MKQRAFGDNIICKDGDLGDVTTASGIIIKDNIKESQGITPRWFKVVSVGEQVSNLFKDDWVLVEYGRWSNSWRFDGVDYWKIDPAGCLATAKERPNTVYYNRSVATAAKRTLG